MTGKLLLIELNELNFEMVERYVAQGALPNLGALIARHGYARTQSETAHADIEPWIQWVTAHTGKTLGQHGVRRLGDIVDTDHDQIWEMLERRGLNVGAFSPMNAANRMTRPAFFVADPWTRTSTSAPPLVARLQTAVAQAVNDNAEAKITLSSLLTVLAGAIRYASPRNYGVYLSLAARSPNRPWLKAVFLDLLLADVFADLCRSTRVDFASVFLNAAAHIQHHYLHSSAVADAPATNPRWYCPAGADPVRDVYEIYDRIVGQLQERLPAYRLMIATGLHQVAHGRPTFYWRLRDHAGFMARLDISPTRVDPLMSRDFVLHFADSGAAASAAVRLEAARAAGAPVFEVDNRGENLFVTFVYPHDIPEDLEIKIGNESIRDIRQAVAFVAIKNGEHDGDGYLLDTGRERDPPAQTFPLHHLTDRIVAAVTGA
jgi:hypothetical protein